MKSELNAFMKQLQQELSSEYERISVRVTQDPGTAGDEGEENWAEILRKWLPSNYHIVTKGRVLSHYGEPSPQVDILVLHPAYPRHLLNKKYYLAGGVLAAFECKLTLRTRHLEKIFKTSSAIKNLVPQREGSPYKELQQPIIYGVLAHSHEWSRKNKHGAFDLLDRLDKYQFCGVEHPRNMLDLICIADTAIYRLYKTILIGPNTPMEQLPEDILTGPGANEGISIGYTCTWQDDDSPTYNTVLGTLIADLFKRMAYEDQTIRPMAEYYTLGGLDTGGISKPHFWFPEVLSKNVLKQLRSEGTEEGEWSEWAMNT
jgi:hypothetical protein